MQQILALDRVRYNVAVLKRHVGFQNGAAVRNGYFAALDRLQAIQIPDVPEGLPPWLISFDTDGAAVRGALDHLGVATSDVGNDTWAEESQTLITARLAAGYELLRDYDPDLAEVTVQLIAWLIFARGTDEVGGSTASALGVIWLNPPKAWNPADYAACILHESVHQALFLEDMLYRLFRTTVSAMEASNEARVLSAIRRERRPYYLSFHAAAVAAELIGLYEYLGQPELAESCADGLRATVPQLREHERLLTDRGAQVLSDLESVWRTSCAA